MKMMKTITAVAVATALLGGCQSTQSANNQQAVSQSQFPEVKVNYETFTLDNNSRCS